MLAELRIVNFALIDRLHLEFRPGFTVLTGETGAGKSLLIDAIGLLVGGRASTDHVRAGEEEAQLEAAFHLPEAHQVLQRLRTEGVIGPDESELILKRVISRSGRHRIYINGSLCPLRVLEELGGALIDIHGQHEQQSLLSVGNQLDAIDEFGGLRELRGRYEEAYRQWLDLTLQLETLSRSGIDRGRLEELLRFQIREIEQAGLHQDEEELLLGEKRRLDHAHRLRELAEHAYATLQGDEQGMLSRLGSVRRVLAELAQIDPQTGECPELAEAAVIQLKDLSGRLRDYADRTEADPRRQSEIENRLDLIHRLKKKYGGSIEAVCAAQARAREELADIENLDHRIAEVTAQLKIVAGRLSHLSPQLSAKRREAAKRLEALVKAELAVLRMEHTTFQVSVGGIERDKDFGPMGNDRVEFLLGNPTGEPPRPLGRTASGGELSRLMLALKTVLAEQDRVPVLVFDEVDAGVGGAVAAAMGMRLRRLGAYHQVFCITHLPQVASQADHHLLVEKRLDANRMTTWAKILNGTGREEEIARMLGGVAVTRKVRETAAELLEEAKHKR
jgi:DNA repair protein RecN (Recombination protein N)